MTAYAYIERADGHIAALDADFGEYADYWEALGDLYPETYETIDSCQLIVSEAEIDWETAFAPEEDGELAEWLEARQVQIVENGSKIIWEKETDPVNANRIIREAVDTAEEYAEKRPYDLADVDVAVCVSGREDPVWIYQGAAE